MFQQHDMMLSLEHIRPFIPIFESNNVHVILFFLGSGHTPYGLFGTRILTKTHLPDREFAIMLSRETRIARLILDVECSLTRQVILPVVPPPYRGLSISCFRAVAGCQLPPRQPLHSGLLFPTVNLEC